MPILDVAFLMDRLTRLLQAGTHAAGLPPAQWEALRYLARANRFSRSPSALAAFLGATRGTVSQTLIALERKGLVTRRPGPRDRRQVALELTDAGRRLLGADPLARLAEAAAALPEDDAHRLADTLAALIVAMLRQRGGRPFGACHTCRSFRPHAPGGAPHRCALLAEPLTEAEAGQVCVEQEAA